MSSFNHHKVPQQTPCSQPPRSLSQPSHPCTDLNSNTNQNNPETHPISCTSTLLSENTLTTFENTTPPPIVAASSPLRRTMTRSERFVAENMHNVLQPHVPSTHETAAPQAPPRTMTRSQKFVADNKDNIIPDNSPPKSRRLENRAPEAHPPRNTPDSTSQYINFDGACRSNGTANTTAAIGVYHSSYTHPRTRGIKLQGENWVVLEEL